MSERGAFTSGFLYCHGCVKALREILEPSSDFDLSVGNPLIVSGRVSGMFSGEEILRFDVYLRPEIEAAICHPLQIAVLPDSSRNAEILKFAPKAAEPG